MAKNQLVKDGFLQDLPEEIQIKVMNIHKLIVSTCNDVWKDSTYDPIRNQEWAKSAIDEFCIAPNNNSEIGSVRVFKQGKRNSCMIQITGHVTNHRNDIDHELLHDFFRHVHYDLKAKVRKQFDMKLTCESEHGEPFEGFDIWTSSKVATVIWDMFDDMKIKKVKELKESTEDDIYSEMMFAETYELPNGAYEMIENLNESLLYDIYSYIEETGADISYDMLAGNYNISEDSTVQLCKHKDGTVKGKVELLECTIDNFNKTAIKLLNHYKITDDPTKTLYAVENGSSYSFFIEFTDEYASRIWNWLESNGPEVFEEKSHGSLKYAYRAGYDFDTGHALKIVYGLDGAEITNTGKTLKGKMSDEEKRADIKYAQNTIRKKGNLDHQSKGGKVLAIIDRVTGEKLKSVRAIGVFMAPGDKLNIDDKLEKFRKDPKFIKEKVYTIKVGDKELNPTFKSTNWFSHLDRHNEVNKSLKKDKDKFVNTDSKEMEDNISWYISPIEHMNQGRGHKLKDLDADELPYGIKTYKHPKKSVATNLRKQKELFLKANELEKEAKNIFASLPEDMSNDDKLKAIKKYRDQAIEIVNEINKFKSKSGYDFDDINRIYTKLVYQGKLDEFLKESVNDIEDIYSLDININNYYIEDTDEDDEEFVPVYGIVASFTHSKLTNDGNVKSEHERDYAKFNTMLKFVTNGDNYSHALISFDDSLEEMYSYSDPGFVVEGIDDPVFMTTDSIYICVMFVTKEEKKQMEDFVKYISDNREDSEYAYSNLIRLALFDTLKKDKRFVCSSFVAYVLGLANPKNLHRDYSRIRPDDITILPRAFYVMNVKDRQEFINRHSEIKSKVDDIYDEYYDEIKDYNNHLPKLMLQDKCEELRTLDKILDWVANLIF